MLTASFVITAMIGKPTHRNKPTKMLRTAACDDLGSRMLRSRPVVLRKNTGGKRIIATMGMANIEMFVVKTPMVRNRNKSNKGQSHCLRNAPKSLPVTISCAVIGVVRSDSSVRASRSDESAPVVVTAAMNNMARDINTVMMAVAMGSISERRDSANVMEAHPEKTMIAIRWDLKEGCRHSRHKTGFA